MRQVTTITPSNWLRHPGAPTNYLGPLPTNRQSPTGRFEIYLSSSIHCNNVTHKDTKLAKQIKINELHMHCAHMVTVCVYTHNSIEPSNKQFSLVHFAYSRLLTEWGKGANQKIVKFVPTLAFSYSVFFPTLSERLERYLSPGPGAIYHPTNALLR